MKHRGHAVLKAYFRSPFDPLQACTVAPVALPRPSVPLVLGWRGLLERALWRGAGGPRDLEIRHNITEYLIPVSYTHLTLPTKRIV